jgi:tripartite-type tricarboxylate transporter receptor subunit TctC
VRGLLGKPRDGNPSPNPSPYGRGGRPRSRHRRCYQSVWRLLRIIALLFVAVGLPAPALAQPAVEDFYRGRQINLIVGYGPGGRYVAGNPNIVVQNMPGAGSLRAVNYLYSVAPKDGTAIGLFGSDMPLIGLIANNPNVQFDPRKFVWLGSSSSFAGDAYILMVRPDAAAKSIAEARASGGPPLVLAGTGEGARDGDVPKILRDALGLNIKQVLGYPDTPSIFLAVERGEVDGRTFDFSSVKSNRPQWLKPDSGFHILLQFARITRHAELPDVPTARELAPNAAARALVELAETPLLTMARPFAAPPGVPDDRARALQTAFLAAHRDAELRAEAARLGVDISPVGAEDMARSIEQMTHASPDAFDYLKRLLASHKSN